MGIFSFWQKKGSAGKSGQESVTVFSGEAVADQSQVSDEEAYRPPETISEALQNPRYQNKIVIESQEGLFSTTMSERAIKKFKSLQKKYPDDPPVMTVISKGTQVSVPVTTGQSDVK